MKTCQFISKGRNFGFGLQLSLLAGAALSLAAVNGVQAQTAYGVDASGKLYTFNVNTPTGATVVGNIGFALDGIDFNPANGQLYGFQLGATTSNLYTINLATGAPTLVGSFASTGNGYDLTRATGFGFDFNPKTLQPDGSIRIRLVDNNGDNLRLNSANGAVAAVDPALNFASGSGTGTPSVVGAAYSNNVAAASGLTTLYDVTDLNDGLYRQEPANAGTLTLLGPTSVDVQTLSGLDIFTAANGFNTGYLSTNATNTVAGSELYTIDLTSGATVLLGSIGGFGITDIAIAPVPEPSTYAMILGASLLSIAGFRLKRARV